MSRLQNMRLENWTSSLDSVENEEGRKNEPRQIKLIHLFQPRGEGADYAHYITTCYPPGFSDLPTTLKAAEKQRFIALVTNH